MPGKSRPVSVVVIAVVYLLIGAVGFIHHFSEITAPDGIGIEVTELLAFVAGVFLLFGQNWARWLAVAWIAFHVALSVLHSWQEAAIHAAFCAVIAWILFRPTANRYFRGTYNPSGANP